jgi:hypothetical protein
MPAIDSVMLEAVESETVFVCSVLEEVGVAKVPEACGVGNGIKDIDSIFPLE